MKNNLSPEKRNRSLAINKDNIEVNFINENSYEDNEKYFYKTL